MINAAIMSIFDLLTYWGSLAVGMGIGGGAAWIVAVRRERNKPLRYPPQDGIVNNMVSWLRDNEELIKEENLSDGLKLPASMLRGTAPGGLLPDTWPAVRDERNERWARIAQTRNARKERRR